jgi:multidrug efflux pump subunit AcrA (membrane-fusion protein)
LARSQADYDLARSRYNTALLHLAGVGAAASDRERLASQTGQLALEAGQLELKSPIAGVVLTPRPADRLSAYVTAGTELAEIADLATLRARIFVSEYDLYKYRASSSARVAVDGFFGKLDTQAISIAPAASEVDPGLIDLTKYKGLAPPRFYVVDLLVGNRDGRFRPGMTGTARLYGRRRSVAGLAGESTANFFGRKLW